MENTYFSTEKKKRKKTDKLNHFDPNMKLSILSFFLNNFLHFYKCEDLVAIWLIIINNYKTWKCIH